MPDHFISEPVACPTCASPMAASNPSCPNCENKSRTRSNKRSGRRYANESSRDQLMSARQAHQALREKADKRSRNGIIAAVVCMFVMVTSFFGMWPPMDRSMLIVLMIVFAVCILFANSGCVTREQYEALAPRDARSGKAKCVYCGHTGVYRHTPYRSSQTMNDCSGCNEHLYVTGAVRQSGWR